MDANLMRVLGQKVEEFSQGFHCEEYRPLRGQDCPGGPAQGDILVNGCLHPRGIYFPPRRDRYIEVMLVIQGAVTQEINGQDVHLNAGDLLLLNSYTDHGVKPIGPGDLAVNFSIYPQFFQLTRDMAPTSSEVAIFLTEQLTQESNVGQYLIFNLSKHLPLQHLFEIMLVHLYPRPDDSHVKWGDMDHRNVLNLCMGLVFLHISKDYDQLRPDAPINQDQVMLQVMYEYLERNYPTATLKHLAGILCCSESLLSRSITRLTGSSFTELLQQLRFQKAEQLLVQTDLPIADIAVQVGYENFSYFYRRFRSFHNCTPKQYRRQNQIL